MQSERFSQFLAENMTEATLASLQQWGPKALDFAQHVAQHACRGVALITSGGTAVPIEVNAVRYLTNFSSGGRGAGFVEALLQRGWACVFLHHESSARPFRRHLDFMSAEQLFAELAAPTRSQKVAAAMQAYEQHRDHILHVPYRTVVEYLYLLRLLTATFSHRAECLQAVPMMLIAAAAVSDYYIPLSRMSTHKISGGDGLTVEFDNVPKLLGDISDDWHASSGAVPRYLISFKLETEEEAMKKKSLKNLQLYNCDAVVGNMLQNYRERVLVYWKGEQQQPIPLERPEGGSLELVMTDLFLQRIDADMNGSTTK
ncbi:putative mucin-like glycoprotein [Trypanosoma grayi]|uniref:putative mucin-like glycoprotein n=1 Tax=Trypanosoma grayi TaxID=71804 RepID=UPI0004F48F75|nr:putative mucin-like glycoprotein [Trypanosoma grayi]KEG07713.1 putative mucin-like glycoprotein [Trypanosoma grayi]